jgi:hypothetical protein
MPSQKCRIDMDTIRNSYEGTGFIQFLWHSWVPPGKRRIVPRLVHDRFIPNPFQFITIHRFNVGR